MIQRYYGPQHSHSSNSTFKGCEHRYNQVKVLKNFEDQPNEAAIFGDKQHTIAENALIHDKNLAGPMGEAMDFVRSFTGLKIAEAGLAVDIKLQPCEYEVEDEEDRAWFGGWIDVTILNADHAVIIDYKTGKRPLEWVNGRPPKDDAKPPEDQMLRYSLLTFLHYPHLRTIEAYLYYTHNGEQPDRYDYDRKVDGLRMIEFMREQPRAIEIAKQTDEWSKTKSGLCAGYCPVHTCTNWSELKRKR